MLASIDQPLAEQRHPEAWKIGTLKAGPKRVTVCTNTEGFAVNKSNRVVNVTEDIHDGCPLPQPCVLVSFDPNIFNYLLVLPLDGSAGQFQIHCDSINWDKEVTGLHFDSQLKQVFVAQPDRVTAMDLSGTVSVQLDADSLELLGSNSFICAIDGSCDNIFLLDRSGPRLLVLSKQHPINRRDVSLSSEPLLSGIDLGSLAVSGDSIFISDNRTGRVFMLSISSEHLTEHSTALGSVPHLCQIAADSRGHVIVSGFASNSVTVLNVDGTVLQTLVGIQVVGKTFQHPSGVAVLESDVGVTLLVSDFGRSSLYAISSPFDNAVVKASENPHASGVSIFGYLTCRSSA